MKRNIRNVVRIIKRGDVHRATAQINDSENTILDLERTIKSWVHEVRTNRAVESRMAFSKLFGDQPLS